MSVLRSLLLFVLLAPLFPHADAARLALVIGNDSYQHVEGLRNARADARAMAAALTAAGYKVDLQEDRTLRQMQADVRALRQRIGGGDEVVLYFSGHGVQLSGSNYLLPIDVSADNEDQVQDDALSLPKVLEELEGKPRFTLAVIDACRDNPFRGKGRSIGGRGLTPAPAAAGQMVIYAAGTGQQALDRLGEGDPVRNGVFTRVFVREMARPGVAVRDVLFHVREEVYALAQSVRHLQMPAVYDQALGTFYFFPPEAPASVPATARAEPPQLSLLSPGEMTTRDSPVTIRYRVNSAADAPVSVVNVRIDGQLQPGTRNLEVRAADGSREIRVAVPPRDSEIQLTAENRHGLSAPVIVRLAWLGTAPVWVGPGPNMPSTGTIKVGVLHSLSGTMASSETTLKDAILMSIDEINAKGGLLGRKIEPVVVDPASNWPLFAEKARQLISKDKVVAIFGGWTSVSRKSMLPIVEELNGLLFFPVAYEGEEVSKNIYYTGATPNQQAVPAAEYLMSKEGGSARRFVLLGTDYIYPRTTNKILRAFLHSRGVTDGDILEQYTSFGHSDYQSIVAGIKKFSSEGKQTAVVSTINGNSNVDFYKELGNQGLKAADVPIMALSVGEEELRGLDAGPLVGYMAAANYFMSIKNPSNNEFIRKWSAYAKAKGIAGQKDRPLTNDPMEASYIGIQMWAQAVTAAGSTDTDKVIAAMPGQTFKAPSGIVAVMDPNHHLYKSVFIGKIGLNGQINIVWMTPRPIKAQPWSPFIPENKGKKE